MGQRDFAPLFVKRFTSVKRMDVRTSSSEYKYQVQFIFKYLSVLEYPK